MKKLLFGVSLILATSFAVSVQAADYTVEPPSTALFRTPTSVSIVTVRDNVNRAAIDTSKNSALIPPTFGSATSNLRYSGTLLTPNLAAQYADESRVQQTASSILSQPTVTVTSTVSSGTVINGTTTVNPVSTSMVIYDDYTYYAFTEVDEDIIIRAGILRSSLFPILTFR